MCAAVNEPCADINDCCETNTCSRVWFQCIPATSLALGEPCHQPYECGTGDQIWGACSKRCTTNADCDNDTLCVAVFPSSEGNKCLPSCDATAVGCGVYAFLSCQLKTTVDGMNAHVCYYKL
jgi:hypothetical protein